MSKFVEIRRNKYSENCRNLPEKVELVEYKNGNITKQNRKGKPCESVGRKAKGLKTHRVHDSQLPKY